MDHSFPFLKQPALALAAALILMGALLAAALPPRPVQGDSIVQAPVVTASSFTPGHEATNAIDGDPATFWQSAAGAALPQWLQIDLGDVYQLNQLSCWPQQDATAGRVADYAVLLSLDGSSFFTVTQL